MQDLEKRVEELEAAVRWCVVAMVRGSTTRENRPAIVEEVINGKNRPGEAERLGYMERSMNDERVEKRNTNKDHHQNG